MGTRSLYKEDWFSYEHLQALENYVGEEFACAFSTIQAAIQGCLELLGTRSAIVPVIMPVTAPPDTLAGVLRSGGHPLLLDVDKETLQIDASQLSDAIRILNEEKNIPIVLFTRPLGAPVSQQLLDIAADYASVLDARMLPHPGLTDKDLTCTFNVYDLTSVCGSGALVLHRFERQMEQLKQVRSGPMGLSANLPELSAKLALEELKSLGDAVKESPVSWIKVNDAEKIKYILHAEDIEVVQSVVPLYIMEEVRRRYASEPEYPVAEELSNKYICVSNEVQNRVREIING